MKIERALLCLLHIAKSREEHMLPLPPGSYVYALLLALPVTAVGYPPRIPGGCNVNEDMTPPSSMISLRKGYI